MCSGLKKIIRINRFCTTRLINTRFSRGRCCQLWQLRAAKLTLNWGFIIWTARRTWLRLKPLFIRLISLISREKRWFYWWKLKWKMGKLFTLIQMGWNFRKELRISGQLGLWMLRNRLLVFLVCLMIGNYYPINAMIMIED